MRSSRSKLLVNLALRNKPSGLQDGKGAAYCTGKPLAVVTPSPHSVTPIGTPNSSPVRSDFNENVDNVFLNRPLLDLPITSSDPESMALSDDEFIPSGNSSSSSSDTDSYSHAITSSSKTGIIIPASDEDDIINPSDDDGPNCKLASVTVDHYGHVDHDAPSTSHAPSTSQSKHIEVKCIVQNLNSAESSDDDQFPKLVSNVSPNVNVAPDVISKLDDSQNGKHTDSTVREITLNAVKRKENGSVQRNKGHSCMYCHKIMVNLPRHLERVHNQEIAVAKVLAIDKFSQKNRRREAFVNLGRIGDYYHNCEVLCKKSGELILSRRPPPDEFFDYKKYTPCPYCLGFMNKTFLWAHAKNCSVRLEKNKTENEEGMRGVLSASKSLLLGTLQTTIPKDFVTSVLVSLSEDEISETVKNDDLIIKFGLMHFEKFGKTQIEMTRQRMRQLGRLLIDLNKCNGSKCQLSDWLVPSKFDIVIASVRNVCLHNSSDNLASRPSYSTPSLALKLGHSFRKCIEIERGKALRNCSDERNEELKNLRDLMDLEWSSKISSNALSTLNERKLNKPKSLPVTSDLLKLNDFIQKTIDEVNADKDELQWTRLAEAVLSRVVLFNKRRSGEASRMKICNFEERCQKQNEEMVKSLTEFEKKLSSRLQLVEITGKRGRKVPIILTTDMTENIKLLIEKRAEAGVKPDNEYIFARIGSDNHMRGHDCLRKLCTQANLTSPELVTSTNLRKYVATVVQLFNLTENETDWLARHLGHDIRVHRDFYRGHEAIIETTKVSKLLLAVERGDAHLYKGKKLSEIDVRGFELSDEGKSSDESGDEGEENIREDNSGEDGKRDGGRRDGEDNCKKRAVKQKPSKKAMDTSDESGDEETRGGERTDGGVSEKKKKKAVKRRPSKRALETSDESGDEETRSGERTNGGVSEKKKAIKQRPSKRAVKRPWSLEEKEATLNYFKTYILKSTTPRKEECEKCINVSKGALESRSWREVKYFIYNYNKKTKPKSAIHVAQF